MARQKRKIPYIEKCFRRYLESEDSAEFIRSVSQQYTEPTLGRLAQSDRRGTRRAAVMALGFIGSFATVRYKLKMCLTNILLIINEYISLSSICLYELLNNT